MRGWLTKWACDTATKVGVASQRVFWWGDRDHFITTTNPTVDRRRHTLPQHYEFHAASVLKYLGALSSESLHCYCLTTSFFVTDIRRTLAVVQHAYQAVINAFV